MLWQTFLHSLRLPRKETVFKLNRIGMDTTVIYMFILLFIVSIPSLIDRFQETSGFTADMNAVFLLIYFFMFYYLPLTIGVFLCITALAYVMTWVAQLMGRKLKLQLLWKMCAYVTTIPFLIFTLISLFYPVQDLFIWIAVLYILVMLTSIITVYPKRNVRK